MNTYFGLITVYNNGYLPDNSFSRIHGLNFTGAGVSVIIPASTYNGIATATINVNYIDAYNVIGGIVDVKSLNVSPGVSTVSFLNGSNAYFSGQVTASQLSGRINGNNAIFSGIITTSKLNTGELYVSPGITSIFNLNGTNANFTGIVTCASININEIVSNNTSFGILTATQFKGPLQSTYVNTQSLNVSPGISTVSNLTGTNAIYSGILTAGKINSNNINISSLNVSPGVTTVGVLTGTNSYFNSINANTINATTIKGNLTNSALVGSIDVSQASFIGDFTSILTSVGLLSPTKRIAYVDGDILRTDVTDNGAATSGITIQIWTDIWDNSSIHGISTSGWNRGEIPSNGSTQYITGSRLCFSNVNQVFNWINGRSPVDNSDMIINLYKTSSSNEGYPLNKCSDNYFPGTGKIIIQRGPSQPRLSIGSTTYAWGPEHYTGHFSIPNGELQFYEVNINCAGNNSNPNRYCDFAEYMFVPYLTITTSRFKFYSYSDYAYGYMFQAPSPQNASSQTSNGEYIINWQDNSSIYNLYSFDQNTNEFIMNVNQPGSLTAFTYGFIFKSAVITLSTRRGNSSGSWPPANLNVDVTMNLNTQSQNKEFLLFYCGSSYWILDGANVANRYYGGLNLNVNASGTNFNKMNLFWTDPYQTTKIIYFYGGTPLEGPSGNRNRINVTINTSNSNMTGIALYCDSLYSITALNSFSDDNIFKQFYNDLPGINKKAWILSPGCVLDNTFNDTFVSFPA